MSVDFQSIPVVDIGLYGIHVDKESVDKANLVNVANELCHNLKTVGFVYLKNHGVPEEKVEAVNRISKQFYELPEAVKTKYAKTGTFSNGWVQIGKEKQSTTTRPSDYKEAYDIYPWDSERDHTWPNADCPQFQTAYLELSNCCAQLAHRVLYLIGLGLNPQDPEVFVRYHNTTTRKTATAARSLYYPPVSSTDDSILLPEQIGCAEHTDYGCCTFLFQDQTGGLEAQNRKGEFIKATPIPGTVVMNVADLLQRWTADRLVSTVHRVMVPRGQRISPRQSFAFFVHPDEDHIVECYDGSGKYPPVKAGDYTNNRYVYTFQK